MTDGLAPCTPSGKPAPTSVAELEAVTIGAPTRIDGQVTLADYDPAWPGLFEREAGRIRSLLGARVRSLEHVGSTSIPGLCAKPIIDIVLGVANPADEPAYIAALEAASFVLRIREPEWHEHRLLKGPGADLNLHVFREDCPEIDRMLAFRDRLRTNVGERDRYAAAKRDLASRGWTYLQHYADAKSEIVEAIIARAFEARRQARSR